MYILWNLVSNRPATMPEVKTLEQSGLFAVSTMYDEGVKLSPNVTDYCIRPILYVLTQDGVERIVEGDSQEVYDFFDDKHPDWSMAPAPMSAYNATAIFLR